MKKCRRKLSVAALAPSRADIKELVHDAVAAPEGERRAGDFLVDVGRVVLEIDAGGGAIVGAGAVDHAGLAPTAAIFGDELGIEIGEFGCAPADETRLVK